MDYYVPLGSDCVIATVLRKRGLRIEALPFDWLFDHKIENIKFYLSNDFEEFGGQKNLVLSGGSNVKIYIRHDDRDDEVEKALFYTNKHGTEFRHDFKDTINSESYALFKDKYLRRFMRLNNLFHSGKHLIFIRYETITENLSESKVRELYDFLHGKLTNNTTMKLILLVVKPSKEQKIWLKKLSALNIVYKELPSKVNYGAIEKFKWNEILDLNKIAKTNSAYAL